MMDREKGSRKRLARGEGCDLVSHSYFSKIYTLHNTFSSLSRRLISFHNFVSHNCNLDVNPFSTTRKSLLLLFCKPHYNDFFFSNLEKKSVEWAYFLPSPPLFESEWIYPPLPQSPINRHSKSQLTLLSLGEE